jgi:hypothetical protein
MQTISEFLTEALADEHPASRELSMAVMSELLQRAEDSLTLMVMEDPSDAPKTDEEHEAIWAGVVLGSSLMVELLRQYSALNSKEFRGMLYLLLHQSGTTQGDS